MERSQFFHIFKPLKPFIVRANKFSLFFKLNQLTLDFLILATTKNLFTNILAVSYYTSCLASLNLSQFTFKTGMRVGRERLTGELNMHLCIAHRYRQQCIEGLGCRCQVEGVNLGKGVHLQCLYNKDTFFSKRFTVYYSISYGIFRRYKLEKLIKKNITNPLKEYQVPICLSNFTSFTMKTSYFQVGSQCHV